MSDVVERGRRARARPQAECSEGGGCIVYAVVLQRLPVLILTLVLKLLNNVRKNTEFGTHNRRLTLFYVVSDSRLPLRGGVGPSGGKEEFFKHHKLSCT